MSAIEHASTRVVGLWHGEELDTEAVMHVAGRSLVFERRGAVPIRLALDSLDGTDVNDARAVLYTSAGDVIEVGFATSETRLLCVQALELATAVPELTRSLRALGGAHGSDSAAHDRWFGPLLQARRAMAGVGDPLQQLALFDVDRIAEALSRALLELAAQRVGGDAARVRALEALLEEDTVAVREALGRVALAATTLEGSAPDSRVADWRVWIAEVGTLFREADSAWPVIKATLQRGP